MAYSQSFIHHIAGLSGINIMTSSQLVCQLSWQSTATVSHRSWVQIPYKGPEFFSGLIFITAQVVFITAKIAFIFTYLSAVQICEFHIFTVIYSSLHGFIWNQHNVPSSRLLAQSFIHLFTGLYRINIISSSQLAGQLSWQSAAPVTLWSCIQIPYRPESFFQALFSLLLKSTAKVAFIFTSLLLPFVNKLLNFELALRCFQHFS